MMDVLTSVLVLLILGYVGGIVSQVVRLPRIVGMIALGIVIYPAIHPSVLDAALTVSNPTKGGDPIDVSGYSVDGPNTAPFPAQNPAATIRSMALLIALARGGLSVRMGYFKELGVAFVVLATVPYLLEVVDDSTPWLVPFACASVWAPLSPSIVVPNMLAFVESGLDTAGRFVLTGAPLEVSTALLTEGVLYEVLIAPSEGTPVAEQLEYIPLNILGSAAYGLAFALAYAGYTWLRKAPLAARVIGKADPVEPLLVWLCIYLLSYTTSYDNVNTPHLIGYFAALCCAIATQFLLPDVADALCLSLKPVWSFAEAFLFVLTGCVIRPALDADVGAHLPNLLGYLLVVLLVGAAARMLGDVVVAILWQMRRFPYYFSYQWLLLKRSPASWNRPEWVNAARRVALVWVTTLPKATLQASVGPKMSKALATAGYAGAAAFVAPAAAVSILYVATAGSLLTFSVGTALARVLQDEGGAPPLPLTASASGGKEGGEVDGALSQQPARSYVASICAWFDPAGAGIGRVSMASRSDADLAPGGGGSETQRLLPAMPDHRGRALAAASASQGGANVQ